MGSCDLCNADIGSSARRVSPSAFREAVKNGLRPRGAGAMLGHALGVDSSRWVQMALQSPTDWALCSECSVAFDEHRYGHKTRTYQGRTTEEAEANAKAAMAAPPPKKIVKLTVSRHPYQATAEGEGPTLEAAVEQAKNRVLKDAVEIGQAEVVQAGGEHGVMEIKAMDEVGARAECNSRKSPPSALTQFECLVAPRQGFLGIGKRSGVWKAHWAVPFRVRILYKRSAEVTVNYTE